jgi:ribosomal protein S6--L-glutamate ligase
MHIAFLGSADTWYLRDLRRAAGDRHTIEPMPFSRLESCVSSEGIEVETRSAPAAHRPLHTADCVLVRTMPAGSLEQVVFRMDALASLEAAGTLVMNPPKAIEAAVDKYLTTSRLARAGLLVPRTIVCQTGDAAMEAFHKLGGDVVMKPIFGGEGRGITRLADEAFALRAFKLVEQLGGVLYLQEFIEHEDTTFEYCWLVTSRSRCVAATPSTGARTSAAERRPRRTNRRMLHSTWPSARLRRWGHR